MNMTASPAPVTHTSASAWTTFFLTPLPPLPGALVDLTPAKGSVPGRALPTANAIRKQVLLRLWPGVQGDASRERALLLCCNSHPQASWWIRAGADHAQALIVQQLTILLAWRMKQAGDDEPLVGTSAAARTGTDG